MVQEDIARKLQHTQGFRFRLGFGGLKGVSSYSHNLYIYIYIYHYLAGATWHIVPGYFVLQSFWD